MKTLLFFLLLGHTLFAQDTLTIVYTKPHEQDALCQYTICPDTFRPEYEDLKTLYQVKAIKELIVEDAALDSTTNQPRIKISHRWQRAIFRNNGYCIDCNFVWQLLILVNINAENTNYNYLFLPDTLHKNFKRFVEHHKILMKKDFSTLQAFQNLLYNSNQFNYAQQDTLLTNLLQAIQGLTPNTLTMMDIYQKKALVDLVKKCQKGDLLLSKYKGQAILKDNYSGLVLKEIDLKEFEKEPKENK